MKLADMGLRSARRFYLHRRLQKDVNSPCRSRFGARKEVTCPDRKGPCRRPVKEHLNKNINLMLVSTFISDTRLQKLKQVYLQ